MLVNDFAALNIDAALIESAAPDRIALTNGCVCCTLRADLAAAALELAGASPAPQRIVVETSGVADPYGVMEAFLLPEVVDRVFVESCVCVVDALAVSRTRLCERRTRHRSGRRGRLRAAQQMRSGFGCACRVASKRRCAARCRRCASIAPLTPRSIPQVVFGVSEHHAPKSAAHHHADYASFAWSCDEPLELDAFERLVDDLPHAVLRGKGILQFAEHRDERGVFHRVGKRSTLTFEAGANSD